MYKHYDYRDVLNEKDYRSSDEILRDEIGEENYRLVQKESRYFDRVLESRRKPKPSRKGA